LKYMLRWRVLKKRTKNEKKANYGKVKIFKLIIKLIKEEIDWKRVKNDWDVEVAETKKRKKGEWL